jgi:hypothetical protein
MKRLLSFVFLLDYSLQEFDNLLLDKIVNIKTFICFLSSFSLFNVVISRNDGKTHMEWSYSYAEILKAASDLDVEKRDLDYVNFHYVYKKNGGSTNAAAIYHGMSVFLRDRETEYQNMLFKRTRFIRPIRDGDDESGYMRGQDRASMQLKRFSQEPLDFA